MKFLLPIAVSGSGLDMDESTETRSRPEVNGPVICTSSRTIAANGTEPSTRNACHQNPRAPAAGSVISMYPSGFPPALWYVRLEPVPHGSNVQLPSKSSPLFTFAPD